MFKRIKKSILMMLSASMAFTTVLQWDVSQLKANEEINESILPEVSGVPETWTNIVWLVRKLHSRFLYKRTVAGIEAELIIHYALYNDNLYVSHTKVCDMGSKWGFMYRGELIGTDSNAVIFESSFAKETAANIKKNFTNSQFVKKQLDRFCSKYSIF